MKVTGWGHFNYNWEKEKVTKQPEIWDEEEYRHKYDEIERAIVENLRENKYKFDGTYHQYGKMGCPIIDDKYYCTFTMRAWGGIMYSAWDNDGDGMGYCKYAWTYEDSDCLTPEGTETENKECISE